MDCYRKGMLGRGAMYREGFRKVEMNLNRSRLR